MNHIIKHITLFLITVIGCAGSAAALDAGHFASKSRLAEGRWVKVSVGETGIHSISYDALRACGFDDPAKVRVYGFGGTRLSLNSLTDDLPDDLQQTLSLHTADGRLLFYGEADVSVSARTQSAIDVRRNVYDLRGYYFLSDTGEDAAATEPVEAVPNAQRLDTHLSVSLIEREVQNVSNGGAVWHDRKMAAGDEVTYTFNIQDFVDTGMNDYGMFHYTFGAFDAKGLKMNVREPEGVTIRRRSDNPSGALSNTNRFYAMSNGSRTFVGPLADGEYTFGVAVPAGSNHRYAAVDRAYVIYTRANRLPASGALTLCYDRSAAGKYLSIECPEGDIRVWDITDPAAVRNCRVERSASDPARIEVMLNTAAPAAYQGIKYMAFDASAVWPSAKVEGEIANQNLHAMAVPQMLIITTDALEPAARRLAEIHRRTDGLDVAVVTQREVFNEFSSGSRAAMAYRLLANMLYKRDGERFKYLLLYGHSHYDNRHPQNPSREDLVTYECEDEEYARDRTTNYCTDAYFGMLGDDFDRRAIHFGKMSIAVSRLDVTDDATANVVNNKIERYLNRGRRPAVWSNVLAVSDDGDHQGHYKQADEGMDAMQKIKPEITVVQAHNLIYEWENKLAITQNKIVENALASGVGLIYYCGHAAISYFGAEKILSNSLLNGTSTPDVPFVYFATCDVLPYDRSNGHLGQEVMTMADGGAMGSVGASRTVFMEYNQTLTLAFLREYAAAGSSTTFGEVYMRARNAAVSNTKEALNAINTTNYNMLGDPSLLVGGTSTAMTLEDVDGVAAGDAGNFGVSALKKVRIRGRVDNTAGKAFDGEGLMRVYETPRTVYTNERSDKNEKPLPVVLDEDILAVSAFEIKNGRFDFETVLPEPVTPGGTNRVALSAMSADGLSGASACATFVISAAGADTADGGEPVIDEFYIGDSSFTEGDLTAVNVTAYARVSAPGSAVAGGQRIGRRMTMILDGGKSLRKADNYVRHNADGTATVEMPLRDLTPGAHTLTLVAYAVNGRSAERTIAFNVKDRPVSLSLSVEERPATTAATLGLTHDFTATPDCRLIIENADGETVFSRESCTFPYEWRLVNTAGAKVADGLYRAYVTATDGRERAASDKIEIVVIGDTQ